MKRLWGPRSVQKIVLVASLFVLVWQAAAQQPTSTSKPAASSQPAAEAPATRLPIVGNGTTNTVPVFTGTYSIGNSLITQSNGTVNVSGGVTARTFTGDGTLVTNVNAAKLGGLSSSAFAQTSAANTFTADQTINGNLNFTGAANSALILQGNVFDANGEQSANIIGGFPGNIVDPGVIGATIGGGGGNFNSTASRPPTPAKNRRALPRGTRMDQQNAENEELEANHAPGLVLQFNQVSGNLGTIAGGSANHAQFVGATIGGGSNNSAGFYGTVAGGQSNAAIGQYSTIGGGLSNVASCSAGFSGICINTVSGGNSNTATGQFSSVAGGSQNKAGVPGCDDSNPLTICTSTVGGGADNTASGVYSTVAGGVNNIASGPFSTVPGGGANYAFGDSSFAAGIHAQANFGGSFVWNGCSGFLDPDCPGAQDTGTDQFVAAADGGFFFYTDSGRASGATLPAGSGSWSSLSDRNAKTNFSAVDSSALLEKLVAMPISTWNYRSQQDSIRHLGPTAQDFHAAFGIGEDDKHISTVDAEGVALASIQALYQVVNDLKQNLEQKSREVEELRARLAQLEQSTGAR